MKNNKTDRGHLSTLLRKRRQEETARWKRQKKDILGILLSGVLILSLAAVFVIFFSRFAEMYVNLKPFGVTDPKARQIELMTICYAVVMAALVVSGVGSINRGIFEDADLMIYAALPIHPSTLFFAKLIDIYRAEVLVAFATLLPVNLTFAIVTVQSVWYYVFTGICCFLLPLASMAIASFLALPYFYVKKFFANHPVLLFFFLTVGIALLIGVYSFVLQAIKEMLLGDGLKYFFNDLVMKTIADLAAVLYPPRALADLSLGVHLFRSILIAVGMIAVGWILAFAVIRKLFDDAIRQKLGRRTFGAHYKKVKPKKRSTVAALMNKEFNLVLRTPSYAFGYFSIAVVMPLIVYFCMNIGSSLVNAMLMLDANFELALFLTVIFGVLTNTFCATNISRESKMFYSLKAMPIGVKEYFLSKVMFCLMVTASSNVLSAVILAATSYVDWIQALFICLIGCLFAFAQICFATKKDFEHPNFSEEDSGEIKESNNTVSAIIVTGLLISFLLGGVVIYFKIYNLLKYGIQGKTLTYLLTAVAAILTAVGGYLYLLRRLKKKYYEFGGETE